MTTQIRLDAGALNALFPEGSEARVDLSRAVIAAFIERLSLKEANRMTAAFKGHVDQAVQKFIFDKNLGRIDHRGSQLTDGFVDEIRATVRAEIGEAIKDEVRAGVKEKLPDVKEQVYVALHSAVGEETRKALRAQIQSSLEKLSITL